MESRIRLLGVEMDAITRDQVMAFTAARVADGRKGLVANHNLHSLALLGRDDFWELNRRLRDELYSYTGRPIAEGEWLRDQRRFLEEHVYFSPTARALRNEGKARNVALMQQALNRLNGSAAHSA